MATSFDVKTALVLANSFGVMAAVGTALAFLTGDTMLWCLLGISCFQAASLCAWVIVVVRRRIVPISKRRGSKGMLAIMNTQCPPEQLADDRCDGAHCVVCLLPVVAGELCRTMHCRLSASVAFSAGLVLCRGIPSTPSASKSGGFTRCGRRRGSCLARSADRPSRRKQSRVLHRLPRP
mmetsp:Transcript_7902/g.23958  ORF Transcript_7902/g.23958 Transcript_7902/m.23958 type:complete len:179 (-) Transcript_7902:713-1249(-)